MSSVATTRIIHTDGKTRALHPWVWPLPSVSGLTPRIIEAAPIADPNRWNLVLGYEARVALTRFVPVFAAHDGVIVYAGKTSNGCAVCLDHPCGWSTQYGRLDHLFTIPTDRFRRRCKERLRAGDIIGFLGSLEPRLSFELSRYGERDGQDPVTPAQRMREWTVLPWTELPRVPVSKIDPVAA
jgi:murein DD-endopeptidase MepM/ murein hydrolase activator NlpD